MEKTKDFSIIAIIFIIITITVFVFAFQGNNRDSYETAQNPEMQKLDESGDENTDSEALNDTENFVFRRVYITGRIANPGVYDIEEGQRIVDLIEMAGGPLEDANLEVINLAAYMEDAAHIIIPSRDDVIEEDMENDEEEAGEETGLVNINTAGLQRLTTLPGIGQVIAQNIIDYRDNNGGFSNKEEIKNVSRIGDAVYAQISELITVE